MSKVMAALKEPSQNVQAWTDIEVEGTSSKINVNGVDLYYERYGNGQHPILCIPGALGGSCYFVPQINYFDRLGSGYTLIGFDPRGYGRSRPNNRANSSPLYYEVDANDAVGLMNALGFKQFSLLGCCDGGTCAIITAARFPEVIKKLVIWGSHTYLDKTDVEVFAKLRNIDNWLPAILATMENKHYGPELAVVCNEWLDAFVSVYSDPLREGGICKKEVGEVQCPTLILHGNKDTVVPFCQIEFLQSNLKQYQCEIIPEGKHIIHWTYSSTFNKIVDDFLK